MPSIHHLIRATLLAACLSGCSTHSYPRVSGKLNAQSLVRLPAQSGADGIDRLIVSLRARYGLAPDAPLSPLVNAQRPILLDDGIRVIQTLSDLNATGDASRDLRLDLAAHPCLPVARAAAWIGALRLSATAGSDIVSGHVDYRFEDRQVRIDLTGEFGGRECLRVVEIYKRSGA